METVLITGCSSGIGYHVAKGLMARGYNVYVTARTDEDVKRLISEGFKCLKLDYADSESVQDLANELMLLIGTNLYAVFHNGAYGQPGAVEDLTRETLEKQFAANVFGWMELNNRLLVLMRHNNRGRIIFNSSVLGLVSLPFRGAYNASKYAIEGFADTLRLELSDTNIKVSLIEPGPIESRFRANALIALKENIRYHKTLKRLEKEGNTDAFTLPPEAVLDKVIHALEKENPQAHYYSLEWEEYVDPMLDSIVIKTSEDIDDDLWDELDDFHESLGPEDQKLLEEAMEDTDTETNAAGIYIQLAGGKQTVAQVNPDIMNHNYAQLAVLCTIVFIAAIVRGCIGFGFSALVVASTKLLAGCEIRRGHGYPHGNYGFTLYRKTIKPEVIVEDIDENNLAVMGDAYITNDRITNEVEAKPAVISSKKSNNENLPSAVIRISNFPVKNGALTSGFGMRKHPIHGKVRMHSGIDIAAKAGTHVQAMGEGTVVFAGRKSGYGFNVEIKHGNTVLTRYSHLKEIFVEVGQKTEVDPTIFLAGKATVESKPVVRRVTKTTASESINT
ncbi:putative oxidoreductase YbbO [Nymphon striatum]|nr:putative oxidoreductase YbbO [Nymphon striatum]